ncbi:MAG: ABC transporter ATP-binding protein [Anaerolineales bacterium]|nr:ABC transporter ATP-binding protein [Anaerolineales bacterium]
MDNREYFDMKAIISDNRLAGLWRLMRDYRWVYITAVASFGVAAIARSSTYFLLGYFVDDVLTRESYRGTLPWVAAGFLGLALVQGVFIFMSGTLSAKTAESIARRLRNYMFDHIQRLSFTYHDETRTGELIQRSTSDIDAMRLFFADQAIGVGRVVLLFLVNFIGLMILNWQLALLSIIVVPFTVAMSYFFFRKISKAREAYQEQEATLSSTLQENLTGVRVVKAFARQDFERQKYERENWEKFKLGRNLLLMFSFYWPSSDILTGVQMLFGFGVGATMAINGTISIGDYLTYAGMVVWIIWPIRNLGRLITQLSTGMVSYKRIIDVVKEDREPLLQGDYVPAGNLRGEIAFKNVCFGYDPEDLVLKDITFDVAPGQAIALLGSTGSGKTSLVNLLPRFYEYTEGSILLDGIELNRYTRHYLRQQIGIVEQEPLLFSRTIGENISYGVGRKVSQAEIEAAAKAAAVHDVIQTFPDGYETLVGEKGVTLSGGQKQRVAVARTLLKNPRILILDDATSSVDTETEAAIRGALNRLMEGRTTFIIAHRIQSVMNADMIMVFDKGRIVQKGVHNQLLEEEGMYREVFDIQTQIDDQVAQEIASVDA